MVETITVVTLAISIFFLLIIVTRGNRSLSMIYFSLLLVCFILWTIFNYFSLTSPNQIDIEFWMRMVMFITVYLILFLVEFANVFPSNKQFLHINFIFLYRFLAFFVSIIALSDLVIKSASVSNGNITPVFGTLIPIYGTFVFGGIGITGYTLRKRFKKGNSAIKRQLRFMAIGLMSSTFLGATTNLVFVLLGFTNLVAFGPVFVLILLTSIFILLINGQLFDIRVFFGTLSYYFIAGLFLIAGFYTTFIGYNTLFGQDIISIRALLLSVPIAIIFVALYDRFKKLIQNQIDARLINPGFDPKEVIVKYNKDISLSLDKESIADTLISTISKTTRPNFEVLISFNKEGFKTYTQNENFQELNKGEIDMIIKLMTDINYEAMNTIELWDRRPINNEYQLSDIIEMFEDKDIRIVVPVGKKENFQGILLLGQQDSDAPYTSTQKSYLSSLSDVTALALTRSKLYEEVQEFNKTLQAKVDAATAELKVKNDALAESLRKERDMMDILGHELRTPLGTARNSMIMLDDLKKDGDLTEDKYKKYMDIALDNIRREKDLLQTILQSARLENDRLQINAEQVKIVDIVENSLTAFTRDVEEKKLELKREPFDEALIAYSDPTAIQQITDNLISNAIKYTHEGSITLFVKDLGEKIQIGVRDTGEGISKENIENIGKKFYRINPFLEKGGQIDGRNIIRPGGTGIGLYVVKGLLKAMGSELKIESELGKGSIFSFEVPKFTGQKANVTVQSKTPGEPISGIQKPKENVVTPDIHKLNTQITTEKTNLDS